MSAPNSFKNWCRNNELIVLIILWVLVVLCTWIAEVIG